MPSRFDRRRLTAGRRSVGPPEVVVENSFAREPGLRTGDRLTRGRRRAARHRPGRESAASALPALGRRHGFRAGRASDSRRVGVRLDDPEATDAFVAAARQALPRRPPAFTDWHEVRDRSPPDAHLLADHLDQHAARAVRGRVHRRHRHQRARARPAARDRAAEGGRIHAARLVALLVGEYLAIALAAGVLGLIAGAVIARRCCSRCRVPARRRRALRARAADRLGRPDPARRRRLHRDARAARGAGDRSPRCARRRAGRRGVTSRAARCGAASPAGARLGVKDAFASRSRATLPSPR